MIKKLTKLNDYIRHQKKEQITKSLNLSLYVFGFIALFLFITGVFFEVTPETKQNLIQISEFAIYFFVLQEFFRFILARSPVSYLKERKPESSLLIVLLIFFLIPLEAKQSIGNFFPFFDIKDITFIYFSLASIFAFFAQLSRLSKDIKLFQKIGLRHEQVFSLSFLLPIFLGAIALKLPKSTVADISWIDAFFTATSAICVTGLMTIDMDAFTLTGKTVIMFLFQAGGIGIMTLTMFFTQVFLGKINIGDRILMSQLLNLKAVSELKSMLAKICFLTFIIEAIGAFLLFSSIGQSHTDNFWENIGISIFHSISAFCNAGFSLFENSLFTETIRNNYGFGLTISLLIIIGGLGFPVLSNLISWTTCKLSKSRQKSSLTVHSKLVLTTTAALITFGTLLIFIFEHKLSLTKESLFNQVYHSYFFSVTSRTAGFNTWPTFDLGLQTTLVIIILMWIGASPMSTGGGIKTTTFAASFLHLFAVIRKSKSIKVFKREVSTSSISQAFAVTTISLATLFIGLFLLTYLEPHLNSIDVIFEGISAWGTVGLSRGITDNLSTASKYVLIFLMFSGRIGALTVLFCFVKPSKDNNFNYPKEDIIIT